MGRFLLTPSAPTPFRPPNSYLRKAREAPVRFGYGLGMERFKRFRFSVPVRFLCKKGFSVCQYSLTGKDGSGSGFGSWKTVPAVPVPLSVSGKTVPAVPVSGSGSQRARRGILMPRGRETIFAAQLPRNYPHRGGNFERGKNVLYCGGEAIWEAF